MKPILLNITPFPYIGQILTKRWKEGKEWKEQRGYYLISISPRLIKMMNPKGELRYTDYGALCRYFIWEGKEREPICYEAS